MQSDFDPLPPKPRFVTLAVIILLLYLVGVIALMFGAGVDGALNSSSLSSGSPLNQASSSQVGPAFWAGLAVCLLCYAARVTCYIILLHGMWKVVQDGRARATPGAGACLAGIPILNLVGNYFGFYGLACDLTRVARERGLNASAGDGLALSACICFDVALFSCLPIIGCIFSPAGLAAAVLWFVALFRMANVATMIATTPAGAANPAPYPEWTPGR